MLARGMPARLERLPVAGWKQWSSGLPHFPMPFTEPPHGHEEPVEKQMQCRGLAAEGQLRVLHLSARGLP